MNVIEIDMDQIIINLRKGNYRCIGSGSGRRVYDLENGYVVKVAKNKRGIAQNEAEYHISATGSSDIFARILKATENFSLLIMEKAERIIYISDVWKFYHVKSNWELFQLDQLKEISSNYNLLLSDLCRPVNWGTINDRPVIIDYGYTLGVKNRYYRFF